jgi:hypothetical protein
LFVRFVPLAKTLAARIERRWLSVSEKAGLFESATRAQWLLAAQIGGLALFLWIYRDFARAVMTFLDTAPPEVLAQLSESNDASVTYRMALSVLILVMAAAWYRLLRPGAGEMPVDRSVAAAGIAVAAVAVVLVVVPFRLVHGSVFQAAELDGRRCYITGARGGDLLLFCPDDMPRNRVVQATYPTLRRLQIVESIFASVPAPGHQ